jgi:hypothetical protein
MLQKLRVPKIINTNKIMDLFKWMYWNSLSKNILYWIEQVLFSGRKIFRKNRVGDEKEL